MEGRASLHYLEYRRGWCTIRHFVKKGKLPQEDRGHFAYASNEKMLHQIKSYLRGMSYDNPMLLHDLKQLDDLITDMCTKNNVSYNKDGIVLRQM